MGQSHAPMGVPLTQGQGFEAQPLTRGGFCLHFLCGDKLPNCSFISRKIIRVRTVLRTVIY